MLLVVENSVLGEKRVSTEGYLFYGKEEISDELFTVEVRKIKGSRGKQVHFTLIVSTADTVMRL